jgi:2-C-methyl-D-erythritol 4-phosphate cytidylyltransferase
MKNSKYAVIIAAGGRGKRFGENKQFFADQGEPIAIRTLRKFQEGFNQIIVVTSDIKRIRFLLIEYKLKCDNIVLSGKTRTDSIRNGLTVLKPDIEYVLVHDGARPNVSEQLIKNICEVVVDLKAVIPVIPVKDTIKEIEGNKVQLTPERSKLVAVQTPQAFDKDILIQAYQQKIIATDDAGLVEKLGVQVYTIPGEENNIKITTKEDLKLIKK